MNTAFDFVTSARKTIQIEVDAVLRMRESINDSFSQACQLILKCNGRVVVLGIGKSGHIAKKIAATLASTGTPAFFVHPAEASHGDLGMITKHDLVVVLSNSGTSPEILALLPTFTRIGTPIISLCGKQHSELAKSATINLDVEIEKEACPLDLAPTSSTTASLIMGDAIAVALLEARGFTHDDFAHMHPGGALGKKLLLRVEDVMHDGENMPCVYESEPLVCALKIMSDKGFGMTAIKNADSQLVGIFTDGDLRRCVTKDIDIKSVNIGEVMTHSPQTVHIHSLAAAALNIMESKKISALIATDDSGTPKGVIHLHDALKEGLA